ncbi:MAG: PucR family transcriptional regulator ligand-binding domain-containing protein [Nocardioidaceae bacterium]
MASTLRDVLGSAVVRAGRPEVLAGADQLDRAVRWVHVSEVPEVAGLLTGRELILSTGLPLAGDAESATGYVRSLVDAGAAGLVVELGGALDQIPAPAVEIARQLGFPLVALHRTVRFVDITEQVHREIVADQFEYVEFARAVHERFTSLSLESASAREIVTAAADLADSSVVLEDLSRHVVAHTVVGRPAAGLLARWEARSRLAPVLDHTGLTGTEGWMTSPVGVRGQRWGRLVVPEPRTDQSRLSMVLERAAQALELGRMVERDRLGLELQAQAGLLGELATDRVGTEEEAVERARALGLPRAEAYLPVVVHRSPGAAPIDEVAEHSAGRRLLERVSEAARRAGIRALVGSLRSDQVGLLVAMRRPTEVEQLADRLGGELTIGVGDRSARLLPAGAALPSVAQVAEVASGLPAAGTRRVFHSRDVRLHGLISLLHDDPRLLAFTEAELGPLLAHDAAHPNDPPLVDLLRLYVRAGGNKSRLAGLAHRSRPTLYKQLARIERILGTDLSDPTSLLALGVAMLAYDQRR